MAKDKKDDLTKITVPTLKEYAKTMEVSGYSGMKKDELIKPVMEAIQKAAKDKDWRNKKKNQPMINWFNAMVDKLAASGKGKAGGKGKSKKEKKEKTPASPDFSKMSHEDLVKFASETGNLKKLGLKKKKVSKLKEKKLRKLVIKIFAPADIKSAKDKAGKAKEKAKDKKAKDKKEKGPGVIQTILDTISNAKKPVSKKDILKVLTKAFPDRDPNAMKKTINAQIGGKKQPTRMEKSKKVKFKITKDGFMLKKK